MTETITASRKSVLIVEDDSFLLGVYADKFAKAGCEVHSFLTVDSALAALRSGIKPDVLVFDIVLPEKDGFAFLTTVNEEKLAPEVLRVALTNEDNKDDREHAASLGAAEYLIKAQLIPSEVVERVLALLSK